MLVQENMTIYNTRSSCMYGLLTCDFILLGLLELEFPRASVAVHPAVTRSSYSLFIYKLGKMQTMLPGWAVYGYADNYDTPNNKPMEVF
jgi:hypothetical protein